MEPVDHSFDWNSIHLIPYDEMVSIQCEVEGDFPHFVIITEYDYRRLTEAGVVKTIFDQIYDVFVKETDPSKLIPFVRWQMDRFEARHLYEYIHFSLKHDKSDHPYQEAWQQLADNLLEYAQKLEQKYTDERKIVYVCPGGDYRVFCLFSNGQWRIWDASGMLNMHLMKQHMEKDSNFFNNAIAVINDTLAWDRTGDRDPYECIDIDPATIWDEGKPMSMEEMVELADAMLNRKEKDENVYTVADTDI